MQWDTGVLYMYHRSIYLDYQMWNIDENSMLKYLIFWLGYYIPYFQPKQKYA